MEGRPQGGIGTRKCHRYRRQGAKLSLGTFFTPCHRTMAIELTRGEARHDRARTLDLDNCPSATASSNLTTTTHCGTPHHSHNRGHNQRLCHWARRAAHLPGPPPRHPGPALPFIIKTIVHRRDKKVPHSVFQVSVVAPPRLDLGERASHVADTGPTPPDLGER